MCLPLNISNPDNALWCCYKQRLLRTCTCASLKTCKAGKESSSDGTCKLQGKGVFANFAEGAGGGAEENDALQTEIGRPFYAGIDWLSARHNGWRHPVRHRALSDGSRRRLRGPCGCGERTYARQLTGKAPPCAWGAWRSETACERPAQVDAMAPTIWKNKPGKVRSRREMTAAGAREIYAQEREKGNFCGLHFVMRWRGM